MTETVQCDACHNRVPETECTFEQVPGATLAFCSDCSEKPYRRQVL